MSRVLKVHGTDAPAIRALHSAWETIREVPVEAPPPAMDPELLMLREEREGLRRRLEQQSSEIADLRKQADAAFREGESKGRDAGRREAEDQSAKMLAKLESGIEWALQAFAQSLAGLERLAPEVARHALAGILGQEGDRSDLVSAIVKRQLNAIETQSVLYIAVSAADFADDAALLSLSEALGTQKAKVQAYSSLKSGDCRIQLKLGALDVGVDQQWGRLDVMLTEMAQPGGDRND